MSEIVIDFEALQRAYLDAYGSQPTDNSEFIAQMGAAHRFNASIRRVFPSLLARLAAAEADRDSEQRWANEYHQQAENLAVKLAAAEARVAELEAALQLTRIELVTYAENDKEAGGNGYGCYCDPYGAIDFALKTIDAALVGLPTPPESEARE